MRIRDLFEAPLADYDTFGDLESAGSFRNDDLRAFRNPKWQAKVFRAFEKTPYRFNIYLYNGPEGMVPIGDKGLEVQTNDLRNLNQYQGIQPISRVAKVIGKTPPDAAQSITVLLVENEGDERLTLTPWMLAHRVCHAIFAGGAATHRSESSSLLFDVTEKNRRMFTDFMATVTNALRRSDAFKHHFDPQASTEEWFRIAAQFVGTFRSARLGKIIRPGEFLIDSMAQYLIQGRVRFERPIMNDKGRTPPLPDDIDTGLLDIAKKYPRLSGKDRFVDEALRTRYRFKSEPYRPRHNPDGYVAYDASGTPVAAFSGAANLEKYQTEYPELRIEKAPPPTRQSIVRYETYHKRKAELEAMFDMFHERDLVIPYSTATDDMDDNLTRYEVRFTESFVEILNACVGKAVVL